MSTMDSDPFPPSAHADPSSGTASIPAVTDAMMDHAAHRAAELVEEAARGSVPGGAASDVAEIAVPSAPEVSVPSAEPPAPEPTPPETAAPTMPSDGEVAAPDAVARTGRLSEASLSGSAEALARYNAKLFEVTRANMAAAGTHAAALLGARSVPEAVALNADHLRRRFDTLTVQGRELSTLAQKLTIEALGPLRGLIAPDR